MGNYKYVQNLPMENRKKPPEAVRGREVRVEWYILDEIFCVTKVVRSKRDVVALKWRWQAIVFKTKQGEKYK